jgi:hypothetical protein
MKRFWYIYPLLLVALLTPVWAQEGLRYVGNDPTGMNSDHIEAHVYMAGGTDRYFGQFTYFDEVTTTDTDVPSGWSAGDRVGYRCLWDFGDYRDYLTHRATYTSIGGPAEGGASINEKYMVEGYRHYDGTPDHADEPNRDQFDDECTNPPSGDGISTAGPTTTYPDRPLTDTFVAEDVILQHGPHTIEVRDFSDLEDTGVPLHSSLRLDTVAVTDRRITVIGYDCQSGVCVPKVEIHFDLMAPGVIVPGTEHPVTLHSGSVPAPEPSPSLSPAPSPTESPTPSPESSPEPSPSPEPLTADFDGDGDVDLDDLAAFIAAFIAQSVE